MEVSRSVDGQSHRVTDGLVESRIGAIPERDWLFAVLNVVLDVPLFVVDSNQIGHVDVGAHFYAEIVAGQEIPS